SNNASIRFFNFF
ncbi:hypothetical protein ACTA71_004079, partial [Dictyostelium dimigraforme]